MWGCFKYGFKISKAKNGISSGKSTRDAKTDTVAGVSTLVDGVIRPIASQPSQMTTESKDDEDAANLDFWCLSGCVTTICSGVLIIIAFPAGVLLCVYASNNNVLDKNLLAIGIVLSLFPVIVLPIVVVVLFNRRRLKAIRKQRLSSESLPPTDMRF
ncbi:uncharacterized protein LOC127865113 [Dreissena polymorpha]|uniref:Uncharacterized protein n=1 Tax=Dreissena polymorpha TaxID=45954 RepID=A0A9D4RTP1_DREPO|nr:uncharacterized protein LOC127865113 [Dreissena polymorpha]KAH3880664.1 hypothetical protein DPMN_004585 [Dreissena polymorpha]